VLVCACVCVCLALKSVCLFLDEGVSFSACVHFRCQAYFKQPEIVKGFV